MAQEANISPAEAAERLGVSLRTVWRRIEEGDLPTVHMAPTPGLAPRTRVRVSDLNDYIKGQSHVA